MKNLFRIFFLIVSELVVNRLIDETTAAATPFSLSEENPCCINPHTAEGEWGIPYLYRIYLSSEKMSLDTFIIKGASI